MNVTCGMIERCIPMKGPKGKVADFKRQHRLGWLSTVVNRKLYTIADITAGELSRVWRWLHGRDVSTGQEDDDSDELAQIRKMELSDWFENVWKGNELCISESQQAPCKKA